MARQKRELMGVMYNDTLKPITDYQKEYHRKRSAKYIYVFDKEKQTAFCSRCETNFMFDHKTKHLNRDKCPCCGKELTVTHTWRSHSYLGIRNTMAIPKALDEHTLVLRFVGTVSGYDSLRIEVKEIARMYIDEYRAEPEYWSYVYEEFGSHKMVWKKQKCPYFNETVSFYTPNRNFVGYAYEYPRNFYKEINKLDCFKYYPVEKIYSDKHSVMQLHYLIKSARINEKLFKIGFTRINEEHRSYYSNNRDRCFPINANRTDLCGMLRLDKRRLNIFKHYCKYGADPNCTHHASDKGLDLLRFLQKHNDITFDELLLCNFNTSDYNTYKSLAKEIGVTYKKIGNYLSYNYMGVNGQPSQWEYLHYIRILNELGYNLKDTYYSMPKDFRKADERITAEWNARQEELRKLEEKEQLEKDKRNNEMIAKISKGLMELPEIKELCGNSKGLLVYVPDSAEALHGEGKALHNCLSTYVSRVASKKTLIFYIRKLENPTAPFVAMEMSYDGKIHQIRYDHNIVVKDENIIDFASKVAEIVKKHSKELLKVA